ncbi:hypothetical protein QBC34DRAFT_362712 [Podospora aff. communis PSN243]|uniref:Exonuclease domain-containing protein n=1 Tax=Podospora aff. communis PSN243 TaxID=3040156 RepID=A0AAV9G717_9PEZI|nr:hypothetical protein QBC34DRAFT_362712 [Podospora aff. communis PSN243]
MPSQNGSAAAVPIQPTKEYLTKMTSLVLSFDALKTSGFVVAPLTDKELDAMKRCKTCKSRDGQPPGTVSSTQAADEKKGVTGASLSSATTKPEKKVVMHCKSHPGAMTNNRVWSCCGKPNNAPPCVEKENHDVPAGQSDDLMARWRYYPTPATPQASHRAAVALDCEMGIAIDMESELVRVTVIDYFTGENLVDSLVWPDIDIKHYNTRYSGVTRQGIKEAHKKGECLLGGAAARKEVFKFVGPETIVVGHDVKGDLRSLRWIHLKIIDTHILEVENRKREEAEKLAQEAKRGNKSTQEQAKGPENALKEVVKDAVEQGAATEASADVEGALAVMDGQGGTGAAKPGKPAVKRFNPDGLSLKALTHKHLGRDIQTGGKAGHDSFEDSLASRDLLHHWITNYHLA